MSRKNHYSLHLVLPSVGEFLGASNRCESLAYGYAGLQQLVAEQNRDGALKLLAEINGLLQGCQSVLQTVAEIIPVAVPHTDMVEMANLHATSWHGLTVELHRNLQFFIAEQCIVAHTHTLATEKGIEFTPEKVRAAVEHGRSERFTRGQAYVIQYPLSAIQDFWDRISPLIIAAPSINAHKLGVGIQRERAQIAEHLRNRETSSLLMESGIVHPQSHQYTPDKLLGISDVAPQIEPPPDPVKVTPSPRRRCYERDHLWLAWYEESGSSTFHSPTMIRDKWNSMKSAERQRVCLRCSEPIGVQGQDTGTEVVKKAITKAKSE